MAYKDIDQLLIDECCKTIVDYDKIKELISNGADINAYIAEEEECLYESVLDYYVDNDNFDLSNLLRTTELFIEKRLILNPNPSDPDCFVLRHFRFLPPTKTSVTIFKLLLENLKFSNTDINRFISDAAFDLHLREFFFFEGTEFSEQDSIVYFLELIYWACAYDIKAHPSENEPELLEFDWFNREENKINVIWENRSTYIFIESLKTHKRTEINGWTMKY